MLGCWTHATVFLLDLLVLMLRAELLASSRQAVLSVAVGLAVFVRPPPARSLICCIPTTLLFRPTASPLPRNSAGLHSIPALCLGSAEIFVSEHGLSSPRRRASEVSCCTGKSMMSCMRVAAGGCCASLTWSVGARQAARLRCMQRCVWWWWQPTATCLIYSETQILRRGGYIHSKMVLQKGAHVCIH